MSEEELSRVYTINLSKVWLSPRIRRTKRAINVIREFAQRHMKSEEVKIDRSLNEIMWERGIRKPPRKIRVKMVKDEDDVVTVSLYSEEVEEEKVEEKARMKAGASTVPVTETEVKPEVYAQRLEKAEEQEVVEEKPKKKEKAEQERVELSEEELAELLAQEAEGIEVREEETAKRKYKTKEESA
ncbi:MAG: 50S ribosomal protein L31e [Nitrososphaerales archaeon]